MADLVIAVDIDAKGTKSGAAVAKSAIKEVGDETEKTGRKVKSVAETDMKALDSQMKEASKTASMLGTIIGTAIGTAIAAIVAATIAIVTFAREFAATGVAVGKAMTLTDMSAESLSALEMQCRRTGLSFDELGSGVKNFTKLVGDAANGSDEAEAKMKRLGIDPVKAINDLDGAFKQVLLRIVSLKTPTEQANAAMDAFGENGYKLLPFIRSFNGDIDGLIKKAREFGVVLSEQDVRAAQEFDQSMRDAQESLRGLTTTLGRDFLPVVKSVFDALSAFYLQHKSEIQTFSENTAFFVLGVIRYWEDAKNAVGGYIAKVKEATGGDGSAGSTVMSETMKMLVSGPMYPIVKGAEFLAGKAVTRGRNESRPTAFAGGTFTGGAAPYLGGASPKKEKLTDEQKEAIKQAKLLDDTIKNLNLQIQFYGDKSEVASVKQQLLRAGIDIENNTLAKQAIQLASVIDKKNQDVEADKKRKEALAEFAKAKQAIDNAAIDERIGLGGTLKELQQQLELGRELTDVERQRISNAQALIQAQFEALRQGMTEEQVKELVDRLAYEQGVTLEIIKQIQAKRQLIEAEQRYKSLIGDLDQEYLDLTIQLQEYTTGVRATRVAILELSDAYKQLTPEQQAAARSRAADIDQMREAIKAQEEARRKWDEVYGTIRDSLQVLAEDGFGAFFKNVAKKFQSFLLDLVAQWLTSKFFELFYKGGNAQIGSQNGQSGGILGGIFQGIFGGGVQQGPGGTPMFNPNGGGQAIPPTGTIDAQGNYVVNGNQPGNGGFNIGGFGGGMFKPIKPWFGKMSPMAGRMMGIGAIASLVGGFLPGRLGNVVSYAGMGLSFGSMIGGPIGGLIGAGIGAIAGLFMGDPKKKRDKKEKIPQLEKGFADALAELRKLAADRNTILRDPAGVMARAIDLRAQIAGGFGIEFESKKYQKIARHKIKDRLVEADTIIAELKKFADVAFAAGDRDRRLLPEFASGVFMSPAFMAFRRRNGMLGGAWTGRDVIPSMLAQGEMVLNPMQQQRVKALAGFDVFKPAAIPGYAGGGMAQTSGQSVMSSGETTMVFNFEHSIDAEGMVRTVLKNSNGVQREVKLVVSDGFANDEIKTRRRGG